jgi:Protein of unknown function (DUF3747)
MKRIRALAAGASIALLPCIFQPSLAVTFGQTELKQDKLIAIAVPRASGYYSLIVLEQLSDKKPCWSENGSKPTRVEPLLVNFDFTGICGRSTDSNGYSLRVAGQELGMTHRLSIQKRENDLVLVGLPSSGSGKPLEVGRTNGIRSGFLKIDLSPGWKFSKRTYSGKTLGHIYLSRATPAPIYQAEKPAEALPPKPKPAEISAKPAQPVLLSGKPKKKTAEAKPSRKQRVTSKRQPSLSRPIISHRPSRQIISSRPSQQSVSPQQPKSKRSNKLYQVMVVTPDSTQQDKVRDKMPNAFRTSYKGKTVMQVGLFSDRRKAEALKTDLKHEGFKVLLASKKEQKTAILNDSENNGVDPLAAPTRIDPSAERSSITVPNANVPIGNVKGAQNVYQPQGYLTMESSTESALPPPPPKATLSQYRVMVPAQGDDQQAKIRALVPGAFRARYKGQSVMQVGSFTRAEEAKPIIQLMEKHGLKPISDQP